MASFKLNLTTETYEDVVDALRRLASDIEANYTDTLLGNEFDATLIDDGPELAITLEGEHSAIRGSWSTEG